MEIEKLIALLASSDASNVELALVLMQHLDDCALMALFVEFRQRVLDTNLDEVFGESAGVYYHKQISDRCEICQQGTLIPISVLLRVGKDARGEDARGILLFEKNITFASSTSFIEWKYEELNGISDLFRKFLIHKQ